LSDISSRRGPNLPYEIVAGVKPCATGWLVASAKLHGTTFAPEEPRVVETFVDVLDQRPAFAVIALGAPIGYLESYEPGGRHCDREARALLGRRRAAAVQSAPARDQVEGGAHVSLNGLNAITRKLLPRYREVAAEMAPYRQRTVYEVNSDLSFYQINGDVPLRRSKRTAEGRQERRELLAQKIPGGERIYDVELPRVPASHMLDVAAFTWTARRIFARAAIRMPQDPEWDETGLRMELVR
jgi:predicted RNase H-like nuclease